MRINFTEHSVDRFIERSMPGATKQEALAEMQRLANDSAALKERTNVGDLQILVDGGIVFVLKYDRNGQTCVTVLFDRRAQSNPLLDEMEEFGAIPNFSVIPPLPRRRCSRRSNRFG